MEEPLGIVPGDGASEFDLAAELVCAKRCDRAWAARFAAQSLDAGALAAVKVGSSLMKKAVLIILLSFFFCFLLVCAGMGGARGEGDGCKHGGSDRCVPRSVRQCLCSRDAAFADQVCDSS